MTQTPPEQDQMPDGNDKADAAEAAQMGGEVPLAEQIEAREQEIAQLKDRVLREMAETENVRRRLEREKQDASTYAMTNFARELLGVADNLRRALAAVPESARQDKALGPLLVGIEMTEKELLAAFGKFGIQKVGALGEALDPNKHQAMVELASADAAPGTIVQVMQDGYMIKERLLRPAFVAVAKAASEDEAAPPAGSGPGSRVDTSA